MTEEVSEDILDINNDLRIIDSGGTNYVSFPSPATPLGSNITFPLPNVNATAGQIYLASSTLVGNWLDPGSASLVEYYNIQNQQPSGTPGGTFTNGAWRVRVINTLTSFPTSASNVTINTFLNTFTMQPGTYILRAIATSYDVNDNKTKIRNITTNSDQIIGHSDASHTGNSYLAGIITIASANTFQLQHRCQTSQNTDGFGFASGFGVIEVYTTIEIYKVA